MLPSVDAIETLVYHDDAVHDSAFMWSSSIAREGLPQQRLLALYQGG